jgi:uncharacterized protein (DUF433 family)
MKWTRITVEPGKMGGRACIRGLRMPVATVVRMIASRMTFEEIIEAHTELEPADIAEALEYAAQPGVSFPRSPPARPPNT